MATLNILITIATLLDMQLWRKGRVNREGLKRLRIISQIMGVRFMSDLFSAEETQKRRIKDLNRELLHVRNLAEKLREESKQAKQQVEELKTQLNNMEACYIQVKKGEAELLGVISDALEAFNDGEFNYCQKQLEMHAKPLRGES